MTDTTDIKALRRQAETVKACGGIFSISGEQALSLLDQLEAERERADDAHKYGSERDSENESLMLTVGRLRLEIAALKAKLANPFEVPPLVELVNGGCILCGKLHPAGMQCPRLRVTSIKGEI